MLTINWVVNRQIVKGGNAHHAVPGEVVHPAGSPQLGHDGINPGVPGSAVFPGTEEIFVVIPGDLLADGVALHAVVVGRVRRHHIVELPPQQLPQQRHGWLAVLFLLLVHLPRNTLHTICHWEVKSQCCLRSYVSNRYLQCISVGGDQIPS